MRDIKIIAKPEIHKYTKVSLMKVILCPLILSCVIFRKGNIDWYILFISQSVEVLITQSWNYRFKKSDNFSYKCIFNYQLHKLWTWPFLLAVLFFRKPELTTGTSRILFGTSFSRKISMIWKKWEQFLDGWQPRTCTPSCLTVNSLVHPRLFLEVSKMGVLHTLEYSRLYVCKYFSWLTVLQMM